jgi:diguanylate cyclase
LNSKASNREAATKDRVDAAERHATEAGRRDDLAARRDAAAVERDRDAEDRDAQALELERSFGAVHEGLEGALRELRAHAASDRAAAAADRRLAARDRAGAAREREETLEALRVAHFDDLTGAFRRAFGEDAIRGEMQRARRKGTPLVLAILDVDGLKEVNDRDGHLAGDELLRDVVDSIRSNIRSYEPIVRLGGDEFAFVISDMGTEGMEERCALMRADLQRRPSSGNFTVGVAEMSEDDELSDLLRRADEALVEDRSARSRAPRRLPA